MAIKDRQRFVSMMESPVVRDAQFGFVLPVTAGDL
jgi:hypothetical protein